MEGGSGPFGDGGGEFVEVAVHDVPNEGLQCLLFR